MRQDLKILCWLNFAIVLYLIYCSSDLIGLLYRRPMTSALSPGPMVITVEEYERDFKLPSDSDGDFPELIPKIIHQTYKTEECPPQWEKTQKSIKDLHPDYQYILWTDETARDFIATHYQWFLPTYDSYKYPIMRADAIRYFVLFHYGGVYIDMDNGTKQRLDPLRKVPAFFHRTEPTGVSNDVMGCTAGHPFFGMLIDNLEHYKSNWILPYITVMYSTGPLFVSLVLGRYLRQHSSLTDPNHVRILMSADRQSGIYKAMSDFFFTARGSSWHNDDAEFIMLMSRYWVAFAVFYTLLGFFLLFSAFWIELRLIEGVVTLSRFVYQWIGTEPRLFGSRKREEGQNATRNGFIPRTSYSRKNSRDFGSRQNSVTALLGNFSHFEKMDVNDMV